VPASEPIAQRVGAAAELLAAEGRAYGPLPITSLNCSPTGVPAMRSGWTKMLREASENNIVRNGCLRMIWKRLSSTALISLVIARSSGDRILMRPALDRGDGVARKHRDVVVEDQPIAKRDRPSQLVRGDLRTLSRLQARGKIVVQREQRVPDHGPVRVQDRRKAPQRVDGCEATAGTNRSGRAAICAIAGRPRRPSGVAAVIPAAAARTARGRMADSLSADSFQGDVQGPAKTAKGTLWPQGGGFSAMGTLERTIVPHVHVDDRARAD
jgi:hypothetical protein